MRKKTKIKVPRNIKPQDYKLYVSFCMEHRKDDMTDKEINEKWKKFKQSLRTAAKEIVERAKELS